MSIKEEISKILEFWKLFNVFENIPYVQIFSEKGKEYNKDKTATVLQLEKKSFDLLPNQFSKIVFTGVNDSYLTQKRFFIRVNVGVVNSEKIEKILKEKFKISNKEFYKDIANSSYINLFSFVSNENNLIEFYIKNNSLESEKQDIETSIEKQIIKVSPFWLYLVDILNNENIRDSRKILEEINNLNNRFFEKFSKDTVFYSKWILDTSFLIFIMQKYKRDYLIEFLIKYPHVKLYVTYQVLMQLDRLKKNSDERVSKAAVMATSVLKEIREKYPEKIILVKKDETKNINISDFLTYSVNGKENTVDTNVVKLGYKLLTESKKNDVIILTTDNNMQIESFENGIPATNTFPPVKNKLEGGITRETVKSMVEWFMEVTSLDKIFSPKDIEYNIISSGYLIDKKLYYNKLEEEFNELPSFFLEDIDFTKDEIERDNIPVTLKHFILGNSEQKKITQEVEEEIFDVKNIPPAKWCGENYEKAFFNQAIAIFKSYKEFIVNKSSGILSVNGPPGTGKTTLLKDIIANIITAKVEKLIDIYTDNKKFFEFQDGIFYFNEPELFDYSIVVASSNNNAVENVTKELPKSSKIRESFQNEIENLEFLKLFKDIFSKFFKEDCWGTISVSLGKQANIRKIRKLFMELDREIFNFFYEVEKDKNGIVKILRKEDVFDKLNVEIDKEIANFKKIKEKIELFKKEFAYIEEPPVKKMALLSKNLVKNQEEIEFLNDKIQKNSQEIEFLSCKFEELKSKSDSFSLWDKIFRRKRIKTIKENLENIKNEIEDRKSDIEISQKILVSKKELLDDFKNSIDRLDVFCRMFDITEENEHYLAVKENIFIQKDKDKQKFAIYGLDYLEEYRKKLFFSAIKLNYLFLLKYQYPIKNNIKVLFSELLNTSKDKESLLTLDDYLHLWNSLFFLFPVVSTTFHSFGKLFKSIKEPNVLGFLIVDEAGQALPYAAVGSLFRSKYAIIVGDPLQIEPVVDISPVFSEIIERYLNIQDFSQKLNKLDGFFTPGKERALKISKSAYLDTSVQILADNASVLYDEFSFGEHKIKIGIPLRIHFRCKNPMFTIANKIAYSEKMIHFSDNIKGYGQIINLKSNSEDWLEGKYKNLSKKEFEALKKLLKEEENLKDLSSVFIITPFKGVENYLKSRIKELGLSKNQVGTVHTFQGKENKVVVFVLGGQTNNAVKWATRKPNLLNVAVTRAKEKLYVIGDINKWENCNYHYMEILKRAIYQLN